MIALDDRARVKNDPTPERTSMNGFLRPWCICIMWTWSARSLYVSVPNSPAASYEMVKIIIFPIGFGMFPQLFLCLFLPAAPPYCWRFCIKGCGIVSHRRETHIYIYIEFKVPHYIRALVWRESNNLIRSMLNGFGSSTSVKTAEPLIWVKHCAKGTRGVPPCPRQYCRILQ